MSLMPYCILAAREVPRLPLREHPLGCIQAAGLAVIVREEEQPGRDVESLLAFGRMVEACHQRATVIPMRYGCLLAGREAVVDHLESRREDCLALLAEVDGCVEMSVRIPCPPPSPTRADVVADSGRAYLLERRRLLLAGERVEREAAGLNDILKGGCRSWTAEPGRFAGGYYYSLHYLVEREKLDGFQSSLQSVRHLPGGNLLISGPWPPYNFTAPKSPWP